MILRDCNACQRRTDHDRQQWADEEGGGPTIHTEYTCTRCGTVESTTQRFNADEQKAHRT